MSERFRPSRFERLAQGGEARREHIEAAREVLAPVDASIPKIRTYERATLFATIPLLLVVIASACSKRESGDFNSNLAPELYGACRVYVEADERGGEDDAQGFSIAFNYFKDNPDDPKALYLSSVGSAFLLEIDTAVLGFEQAIDMGLPPKQKELAKAMIKGVGDFYASGDAEPAFDAILEPIANFHIDLKSSICPTGEVDTRIPDQNLDGQDQKAFDFETIFDCAVNGQYPTSTDCRNELIDAGTQTINPLLREMLLGDINSKRDSSFWVFNEDARILDEISKSYPQEIEEAINKIFEVTECLTINRCNEVVIGDELVNLEGLSIISLLGVNSIDSLVSVGGYPGIGHEIASREFSRIQRIQDWVDQERDKDPYSTDLVNINNKLKEFIFHFKE